MRMVRQVSARSIMLSAAAVALMFAQPARAETVTIGIGTQDTTTNTVTTGTVIRQLHLLEKYLPTTGKYADIKFELEWQNFTSGPPVTNAMMANKLQFGMMGDYPLIVNGFTFENNPDSKSRLIAVAAYSLSGSGNGIVVHKDSPYYELSDLKGKLVSVPFGSAAHGMVLKAMQDRGLAPDFFQLVSQTPEVGSTNLQEKKIDAHADFVPFAELLPFRGFARKIFDGVETNLPTFHGVVVRKDFGEKYPEIVVAYIEALMEANDWMRKDPKLGAEMVEEWTKINKEVVYIFLGPGGIHTLDPTIKPAWVDAIGANYAVLKKLNMIKDLNIKAWVNDAYVRQAYKNLGLDYDKQLAVTTGYDVTGEDPICNAPVNNPKEAGQIWIEGGDIFPFSSPVCTLLGVKKFTGQGKKLNAVYLVDHTLGIKLFADAAFYAIGQDQKKPDVVPFMLKKDAEAYAAKIDGKLGTYADALATINVGQ